MIYILFFFIVKNTYIPLQLYPIYTKLQFFYDGSNFHAFDSYVNGRIQDLSFGGVKLVVKNFFLTDLGGRSPGMPVHGSVPG